MNGERWCLGNQAIVLLDVGQEIMFQHQRDFGQLYRIHTLPLKEAVNRGALQVDLPRKLRYGHAALFESGFDEVSDMWILRGHGAGFQT